MIKSNVYNQKGEEVGKIELTEKIFGLKANEALIHQATVAQMANERQVLAHTKGRAEVRGGGRKPWKQKGTGRARQGSIRSPQWKGGGVVFGPSKYRNFAKNINRKMRQKAMLMVLSGRLSDNNLIILEKLEMPEFKTKIFNATVNNLEKIFAQTEKKPEKKIAVKNLLAACPSGRQGQAGKIKRSVLIINDKKDEKVKNSGRNLPGVEIINLGNINIVDLLKYKNLILTVDGVKELEKRYK